MSAAEVSTVRAGETVALMPAAAHRSEDGHDWVIPLHAWVYVPSHSRVRRTAIAELLRLRYGLEVTPQSAPHFDRRINLLLADNKRGRTVVVDVGGSRVTLPPTRANGHAHALARIPVSAAPPEGGRVQLHAVLPASDERRIETSAHLVGTRGLSVISDIDDTVKVTHVIDRKRMWEATFYRPFEAVAGMHAAYQRMAAAGATFHYVSSSPWHLAEPLLTFLDASGLPVSSIALKQIRLKDRTALDIVKPGRETKPPQIAAILARYPGRRFVLIGDSGEDDPEIYAEALRQHSGQIAKVYIRNVTAARRDDVRFATAYARIEPGRWALTEDAREIE